jgi:hypothetical protein
LTFFTANRASQKLTWARRCTKGFATCFKAVEKWPLDRFAFVAKGKHPSLRRSRGLCRDWGSSCPGPRRFFAGMIVSTKGKKGRRNACLFSDRAVPISWEHGGGVCGAERPGSFLKKHNQPGMVGS